MLLFLGILVILLINVMVADDTLIRDEDTRSREMRGIETIMSGTRQYVLEQPSVSGGQ